MRNGAHSWYLLACLALTLAGCRTRIVDYAKDDSGALPEEQDLDGDGWTAEQGDCDDTDPDIHPGADEHCDGVDEDCDGEVDEDTIDTPTWNIDYDGDGYGSSQYVAVQCERPSGYVLDDSDCDDADASVYPGAEEHCDGADEDCDGEVDEDSVDASAWYPDEDGDAFGAAGSSLVQCDQPSGWVLDNSDCDDANAAVYPGAEERCDGVDEDCDGMVDEDAVDALTLWVDADGDGYGDPDQEQEACTAGSGLVDDDSDCDDGDAAAHPGADEVCDGDDDDCDGEVDEPEAVDASTWYPDLDGDGDGDTDAGIASCSRPGGYLADGTDCDDMDAAIHPLATEVCDGIDDDCDGLVDDDDPDVVGETWYLDADGDGWGDSAATLNACEQPSGYVADDGDCDDRDTSYHPGAVEDDCTDPNDYNCDGSTGYADADGDGWAACEDCDDSDPSVSLGGTWYIDADGDGYGVDSSTTVACGQPSGYADNDEDCDDGDASSYPGAPELCDGWDNDCDGTVDEDGVNPWYLDADGDGYGDPAESEHGCEAPTGYVEDDTDCDDGDAAVNPGATEICGNGVDDDCDGLAEGCGLWGEVELGEAEVKLIGESINDHAGNSVAGAGDVDGDGHPDLLLGAYYYGGSNEGAAYLVHGPVTADLNLASADAILTGENASDWAGGVVAGAGDVNADGFDDLLVGSWCYSPGGVVYLVLGPVTGTVSLATADAALTGSTSSYAGVAASSAGDINADGYDDILVGAHNYASHGAAHLVYGPTSGVVSLASADATIESVRGDYAGSAVCGPGDMNGDGSDDLAVGASSATNSGSVPGEAYVFLGPVSGSLLLTDADMALYSSLSGGGLGETLAAAGDMDLDGLPDLLVDAYQDSSGATSGGGAYLVSYNSGAMDVATSQAHLVGIADYDHAGYAMDGGSDVDGDGWNDVLVGTYSNDRSWLLYGPLSGTISLDDADAIFLAETSGDWAGYAVALPGDTDLDGYGDLLIGAWGDDDGGGGAGAVYLLLGGGI